MAAKPKKCLGTSLHLEVPADPQLIIAGVLLKWIGKEPFKILGKQLCTNAADEAARKLIMKKVGENVLMIDKLLLGGAQKSWILDAVLMSMLSWELLIRDMSVSFAKQFGAIQTRILKEWSHSQSELEFYRNKKNHGWGMKEMELFFKNCAIGEAPCAQDIQ